MSITPFLDLGAEESVQPGNDVRTAPSRVEFSVAQALEIDIIAPLCSQYCPSNPKSQASVLLSRPTNLIWTLTTSLLKSTLI